MYTSATIHRHIIVVLCFSLTIGVNAQTYQWDWAARGGGNIELVNGARTWSSFERILDIKVGTNGNYYYLCLVEANTASVPSDFNGTVYPQNNGNTGGSDLLLLSTDCQGNYLWSKTFGGDSRDYGSSIAMDANDNIYVAGKVLPLWTPSSSFPVKFGNDFTNSGPNDVNAPGPWQRSIFMIKYDSNGNFQWIQFPERDQAIRNDYFESDYGDIRVESNGTSHFLCRLVPGTHLNGQLTVPATADGGRWYVLRYDAAGNYLGNTPLDLEGLRNERDFLRLRYDATLNRYVFGLSNFNNDPFSVNGDTTRRRITVLCTDVVGNEVWKVDNSASGGLFSDLVLDAQSNVYFTGQIIHSPRTGNNENIAGFVPYLPPNDVGGNVTFVVKLDSSGNLLWGNNSYTGSSFIGFGLALNGNEMGLATEYGDGDWDGMGITRPAGNNPAVRKPALVRYDAATGNILDIVKVEGGLREGDAMTAIDVDRFGNYIVGGYMADDLFTDPNDGIPTLMRNDNIGGDFWVGRYAKTDCNGVPLSSTSIEKAQILPSLLGNPVGDKAILQNATGMDYTIYDLSGRMMLEGSLTESMIIFTRELPSGVYLIRLTDENSFQHTLKMLKR